MTSQHTAQIMQFPNCRALEAQELPDYWSDGIKGRNVHMTYDGYKKHQDLSPHLDELARQTMEDGESSQDFLLRQAMVGIRHLKSS